MRVTPRGAGHANFAPATALQAVLTPHNDNGRAGATLAETALTTSTVNTTHFGPLTGLPVRGGGGRGPRDHPQRGLIRT